MTTTSFTINPDHYNATPDELVHLANQLALSPEILQSPFRRKKLSIRGFFKPSPHGGDGGGFVRITPHGLTPEQRLRSLMFFFHCLGQSKTNSSDDSKFIG